MTEESMVEDSDSDYSESSNEDSEEDLYHEEEESEELYDDDNEQSDDIEDDHDSDSVENFYLQDDSEYVPSGDDCCSHVSKIYSESDGTDTSMTDQYMGQEEKDEQYQGEKKKLNKKVPQVRVIKEGDFIKYKNKYYHIIDKDEGLYMQYESDNNFTSDCNKEESEEEDNKHEESGYEQDEE